MNVKSDQIYLAFTVLLLSGPVFIMAQDWNYDPDSSIGPDNWVDQYPNCGGDKQSPINFDSVEVEDYDSITFNNFEDDIELDVENNGNTAQFALPQSNNLNISSGGLPSTYNVYMFQFRWGSVSGQGSEHTVKGKQYDAEMQIVAWNSVNYSSLGEALTQTDGIAVLGVFIQEASSSDFESLTADILGNVLKKDDAYTVASGTITLSDFLPSDTDTFYRYSGSLTNPSCDESIVYTVFEEVRSMTKTQLDAFRALSSNTYGNVTLADNFRPVQDINSRVVYFSGATLVQPKILIPIICLIIIKYFN